MKNKVLYPILLALAVCLGIAIGSLLNFPDRSLALNAEGKREQKLRQIMRYIDYEYLDPVNADSLLDETIHSLLEQLDPHSVYIPADQVRANQESIQGSFVGIGVEFRIYRDSLYLVRIMEEGPSARAGLRAGERILQADTVALHGAALNNQKVLETLKGPDGSKVRLRLYDPIEQHERQVEVVRGEVPVKSVTGAFMLNDSVGMIQLTKFTQRSGQEVDQALRQLKARGLRHLVLDLRNNPGGLLSAAEEISDQFLDKEALIVFTKDRGNQKRAIYASRKGQFEKGKLIVLINGGSASASEIVAGAVQDNDRGLLIGRRSFGKGLVQEEITLSDGSRMRLTTQRYFTPTGRSIQKAYEDYDPGFLAAHNWQTPGATDSSASSPEQFETPAGRTVLGGGGIRPDIRISMDSGAYNRLLYHLAMTVNLDQKAFEYVDQNRAYFNQYNQESFIADFAVDSLVLQHFFGALDPQTISPHWQAEMPAVKERLKAFLGYNLYGPETYLQIFSGNDPYVQTALQQLEEFNWQTLQP